MHPNERLLRDEYAARSERNDTAFVGLLSDDVVWHVPGRSVIAGVYRGKAEVMKYVRRRRELAADTFQVVIHDVLANDQHGFVVASGRLIRGGKTVEWRAHGLYRFDAGKIAECWVLPEDQEQFDEIWSSEV